MLNLQVSFTDFSKDSNFIKLPNKYNLHLYVINYKAGNISSAYLHKLYTIYAEFQKLLKKQVFFKNCLLYKKMLLIKVSLPGLNRLVPIE